MILTRNSPDIEITVSAELDEIPVRGNAIASGNDADDKAVEDEIIARVESGDVWAWCTVRVRVTYRGVLSADSYLGACSYAGEAEFRADSGYYGDLVDECIAELNKRLVILCGPSNPGTPGKGGKSS